MSNYYFSAVISTGNSIYGGASLYFDGNDHIYAQGSNEFDFKNNNFNVEMWIRPDPYGPSMASNGSFGILATTAAPLDGRGFLLGINPNYTIIWAVGGSSWSYSGVSTRSVASNGWTHLSLTREKDTVNLYINGELDNYKNISGLTLSNSNQRIQIGGRSSNNQYYKGYIDELRITTGISRYSLYDTNYEFYTNQDPFYKDTSLFLDYENNQVEDISLQNNACTSSGDFFISDLNRFLGKNNAIFGDNGGQIIINNENQSFDFGTGNFTIEAWVHPNKFINNNTYIPIINTNSAENNESFSIGISKIGNANLLEFYPGNGAPKLYSDSSILLNSWSFITLTRRNGVCNFYVNGLKQENSIFSNQNIDSQSDYPKIGYFDNDTYFCGYINDFRMTKDCRYLESFDFPKTSLYKRNAVDPYYQNTELMLRMNLQESGKNKLLIDESKNNFSISGRGIFGISQSSSKFGNASIEFSTGIAGQNYSGGYIAIPNSEGFDFQNKDFTIEFWYKRKVGSIGGTINPNTCCPGWYGRFFTTYHLGGNYNDWKNSTIGYAGVNMLMQQNTNNGTVYINNNGNANFLSIGLSMGYISTGWSNYILMRKGDIMATFTNGKLVNSGYVGSKPIMSNLNGGLASPTVNIGGTSEGFHSLNGYMDSFRITKGYARYPGLLDGTYNFQDSDYTSLSNINSYDDYEVINIKSTGIENHVKPISISENGAGYFSGNAYLEISGNPNYNFNTGDFSIEFWFKNLSSGNSGIIFATSTGTAFPTAKIYLSGENKVYANFSFSGNKNDILLDFGSANSGIWNHYAIIRNTGSFFAYKNGSITNTKQNFLTTFNNNEINNANIGGTGIFSIKGLLDEFRITKSVARYKDNFTPKKQIEISPNEDKYYYNNIITLPFSVNKNNKIEDISIKPKNIFVSNVAVVDNVRFKNIQIDGGINENGLISYWSLNEINGTRVNYITSSFNLTDRNNNVSNDLGINDRGAKFTGLTTQTLFTPIYLPIGNTQSFTLSFWVKYPSFINPGSRMITFNPAANGNKEWGIVQTPSVLYIFNNFGVNTAAMSTSDVSKMLTAGVWNHVVIVKNGNSWQYFKNGILQLSNPNYSWFSENTAAIFIGQNIYAYQDGPPNGTIDEVGIWNRPLTSQEVLDLYTNPEFSILQKKIIVAEDNQELKIESNDSCTFELWFNPEKTNLGNTIFSKGVGSDFNQNGESDYSLEFGEPSTLSNDSLIVGAYIDSNAAVDNNHTLNVPTHFKGDLLIAVLMWRLPNDQITVPAGWSLYGSFLSGMGLDQRAHIYIKQASDSEPSSYTWSANSSVRNAGLMVAVRDGTIAQVTEAYGNGQTATIDTGTNCLNLTFFTWIFALTTSASSYSQAGTGLTQITDSPKVDSRCSGGYIKTGNTAITVTSTNNAADTASSPNHCGICIQIKKNNYSLNFHALSNSINPILSYQNIFKSNWYHCAIVKEGPITKMFLNGVEVSKYNLNWNATKNGKFYLGTSFLDPENSDKFMNGDFENFKFTKKAKYKKDFNIEYPFNENFEEIKIDKFYDKNILNLNCKTFDGDEVIFDNSPKSWVIENINNVKISAEKSKFGYRSLYFNGSNSYLKLPLPSSSSNADDPEYENVSLLMHMDGENGNNNFQDSSKNKLSINTNGNAQISTSVKKIGTGSAYFNGQVGSISIPASSGDMFDLPDNFTIEGWVYINTFTGFSTQCLVSKWNCSQAAWTIELSATSVSIGIGNNGIYQTSRSFTTSVPTNVWIHIAVVRENNVFRVFLNGSKIGTDYTNSSNLSWASGNTGTILVGRQGCNGHQFNGYIDELRITKGYARYTSNFTPDETEFYDNNNALIQEQFNLVNDDFTIECWIYPLVLNQIKYILRHRNLGGYVAGGWVLAVNSSNKLFFQYATGDTEVFLISNDNISANSWQNIQISKINDTIYMIINGVLNNSIKITQNPAAGNDNVYIGTDPDNSARNWHGYIEGLKITKGASKYSSSIKVPALGFSHQQKSDPNFNNVSLLMYGNDMNGSNIFYDDSRFCVSRLGNGCAYFDGSTSFISTPYSGIGNFENKNFTTELWVKPMIAPSVGNSMGLLNKTNSANSNNSWRLYVSGENLIPIFEYTTNGTSNNNFVQAPPINLYQWNHIAVVRNGSYLTVYSNGVSGEQNNIGENGIFQNNLNMQIGKFQQFNNINMYNGFLEDVRITKNISRYISNFSGNLPDFFGDSIDTDVHYTGVELLLHMNGYHNLRFFPDNSLNKYILTQNNTFVKLNNDILTNGTSISNSSEQSVFGGASIKGIGGSTSYLSIPSRYDFGNFGTGDFTIEWWDYISALNNGYFTIMHYGNDGDYEFGQSRLGIYYSGQNLNISISGNINSFPYSGDLFDWSHNAITRKNGIINYFKNGIRHPSGYLMDYEISRGVNISTIGGGKYGSGLGTIRTISGYIDDIRVTKNIARYIEDFTPNNEQFANF